MIDDTLITLGLLFLFAIIGGLIANRFRQPVILALLLVGTVIGPNALEIVRDQEMISLMIELGTLLFLFFIGLEFSVKKLARLGPMVMLVTLLKVGVLFFIGYSVMVLLGFGVAAAAFTGVAVSFSSTMIILNILNQYGFRNRQEMPMLTGVLIMEDVFGVAMLTVFGLLDMSKVVLAESIGRLIIGLIMLLLVYFAVSKIANRVVGWITTHSGDEVAVFVSLSLCAGFSYLAALVGFGPGVGAFLAGSVISSLSEAKTFEHATRPYLVIFNALFFIAMGTMIDFGSVMGNIKLIVWLLALCAIGLIVGVGLITRVFAGFTSEGAIFSTLAMLPFGTFSLLVARQAAQFDIGVDLLSIVSLMMIVQALMMSLTVRHSPAIAGTLFWRHSSSGPIAGLSRYITSFVEHLRIEHTLTNRLKKKMLRLSAKVVVLLLALLFVIVLLLRLHAAGTGLPLLMLSYGLSLGAVGWLSLICYRSSRAAASLLFKVLGGIEGSWHALRTRAFVQRLVVSVSCALLGLYFPIAVLMLSLPPWTSLVSVALLVFAAGEAMRAVVVMRQYPSRQRAKIAMG